MSEPSICPVCDDLTTLDQMVIKCPDGISRCKECFEAKVEELEEENGRD